MTSLSEFGFVFVKKVWKCYCGVKPLVHNCFMAKRCLKQNVNIKKKSVLTFDYEMKLYLTVIIFLLYILYWVYNIYYKC